MSSTARNRLALTMNTREFPLLGIACLLITLLILVFGLWPFNFHPSNKVAWLANENGIRFYGRGIVFSADSMVIHKNTPDGASLSIEMLVRPYREDGNMLPSLLTLYDENHPEQFFFGQWKKEFLIRIPLRSEIQRRYREVYVENALIKGSSCFITVTSGKGKTSLYVDGKLKKKVRNYSLIPPDQVLSGRLVIGNSPEGTRSWNGAFVGLAIYDRVLTDKEIRNHYNEWEKDGQEILQGEKKPIALYLFNERTGHKVRDQSGAGNHLEVPATFQPLRRIVLELPRKDWFNTRVNFKDITLNVLGFIPFGLFLTAWLRRVKNLSAPQVYGISLLIGACLSLAIELIQAYIPGRDSSSLDVLNNILGTFIGVLVLRYVFPALQKDAV